MTTELECEHEFDLTNLVIGAAAGGLLAATATALLTPKSGDRLRGDLYDAYHELADNAHEIAEDITERGQKAYATASDYANGLKKHTVKKLRRYNLNDSGSAKLALGAIGGGLLGAAVAIYFARGGDLEDVEGAYHDLHNGVQRFAKKVKRNTRGIGDTVTNWVDTARNVLDNISETTHSVIDETTEEIQGKQTNVQDIVHLLAQGFRVWQNFKRR